MSRIRSSPRVVEVQAEHAAMHSHMFMQLTRLPAEAFKSLPNLDLEPMTVEMSNHLGE